MARRPTGSEALERARRDIAEAKTLEQLRTAQAVVLPLDHGLSLAETAKVIGRSAAWVARERRRYIQGDTLFSVQSARGGRRNELLTEREEIELVKHGITIGSIAWRDTRQILRRLFEERLGRPLAASTFNAILDRVAARLIPGGKGTDLARFDRTLKFKIGGRFFDTRTRLGVKLPS